MLDPQELIDLANEIEKPHKEYLEWVAVCNRLERGKPSILGKLVVKYRKEAKSVEMAKSMAYADEEYENYLDQWNEYERNMYAARIKYENLKTKLECLQSALAYQREGIKRGVIA